MSLTLNELRDENGISRSEMGVFLQRILQWCPPIEFSSWLYDVTAGQVSVVQRAVAILLQQDVIQFQNGDWRLADHYTAISPETLLEKQTMILNLPLPRNKFVGRFQLRQQISTALVKEHLLTLIGPGGVGKTRLALQIGYDNLSKFKHGICFVSLSSIETADSLGTAIVQALHISTYGQGTLNEQLIDYFRNKNLLLILDNYEHLLPATGLISNFLENAPGVHLLITSRERLKLYQESVITIPTLSISPNEGDFEASEAAQIFLQRARKVRQNFILKKPDIQYINRICHLVGGLPLGIELAASWVRVLTCKAILREIEKDFDLLTTEMHDIAERHRNMRAIFDYSWRRLEIDEKEAFSRISIFQGTFTREAVAYVVGVSIPMLAQLIDKSLLTREDDGRFSMHPILRQFARDKLVASNDNETLYETLYDKFATYYCELALSYAPVLRGAKQKGALIALAQDVNNIQVAWRWAVKRDQWKLVEQALDVLYQFYFIRNWYYEGASLFGDAIKQLQSHGNKTESARILGRLQARQGHLLQQLGQHEEAHHLVQLGSLAARVEEDLQEMAFCLGGLADIRRHQGMMKESQALATESLICYERVNDQYGLSVTLTKLGYIAYIKGEHDRALILAERAVLVCKQIGNIRGRCVTYTLLGILAAMDLRFNAAQEWFSQSLTLSQEIGDRRLEASAIGNLGVIAQREVHYETAERYFRQALHIYREIGFRRDEALTLYNLGRLHGFVGDYESALNRLNEASLLFDEIKNRRGRNWVEGGFGIVYLCLGAYQKAHKALKTAVKTAEVIDDKQHLSRLLARFALLHYEMGEQDTAVSTGQRALVLARNNQFKEVEILSLIYLGHIYLADGTFQQATQSYTHALALCSELKLSQIALDAHAGLALATLKLGNQETAEKHLQTVLNALFTSNLAGTDDRFKIFLNCYFVLLSFNEVKAKELLSQAYQALQAQAEKLSDPFLRRCFFHQVKIHQMIIKLHKQPVAPQDEELLSEMIGEAYLKSKLTKREMEIAYEIIEGKKNREIAKKLVISNHTVKRHISNIFNKLGISNRYEIIKLAYDGPDK